MPRSNVTVFVEVFNEEQRIESCLKSFAWADELIVFDKQSTDRTREIASKYATKIITTPCTPASENYVRHITEQKTREWVFFITASSLIHPRLVDEITRLTINEGFEYDVIALPYAMYAFGINSKNSPWTNVRKHALIRRSVLVLSSELHREISYTSDKIYSMPLMAEDEVLYHCTHKDADDFFSRHLRYVKYEAQYKKSLTYGQELRQSFREILRSIASVIVKRRSFVLGWDGIALGSAYVSYFIMKFIYVWDSHRDGGNTVYPALRKKMDQLWDERNPRSE